jgi:hypothetical protein
LVSGKNDFSQILMKSHVTEKDTQTYSSRNWLSRSTLDSHRDTHRDEIKKQSEQLNRNETDFRRLNHFAMWIAYLQARDTSDVPQPTVPATMTSGVP